MSINFNGKIKILYQTPKQFDALIDSKKITEVGVYPNYSIHNMVTSPYPKGSRYANTCSIVSINDSMVHLAPEQRGRDFVQKLVDFLKKEKAEKGDVTAFVMGGKSGDIESENLFYEIGNLLEKFNANFSMIGLKNSKSAKGLDALAKNGDTFVFTQEYNPELAKVVKENKSLTSEELQKIFERFYDYIEISPNHKIING